MAGPANVSGEEIALRTVDLDIAYGRIRALQGVSIEVRRGRITALVGANGAGKSSFLKSVAGLVSVRGGRIEVPAGTDIAHTSSVHRVRDLGIVLIPEGRGVFGSMTVDENLAFGAKVGTMRAERRTVARAQENVLDLFPILRERQGMPARYLSGGEQQMLTIGRALLMQPSILLVDEPSMGLAPIVIKSIFGALSDVLARSKMTVILVEQDSELALGIADYAYIIEQGRIDTGGLASKVAEDSRLHAAYLGS